jgi:hypothetical protein
MGQFGLLDSLQRVLSREQHAMRVQILGVNDSTQWNENGNLPSNVTLPWLQDTQVDDVWGLWRVTWRDVWVLDDSNRTIAVYNLTVHSLATPANFDSLLHLLRDAAETDSASKAPAEEGPIAEDSRRARGRF